MRKILIIDFCNYSDYQSGGHLTFAKNMMFAFKDQLALVGITTNKMDPVGKWIVKNINGLDYDFFALARYNNKKTKHFIPDRLMCFLLLKYYRKKILEMNFQNVFVQRQEILPAIKNFGYDKICYRFPGVENPLKISKYWFGKYLASIFEKLFFSSINNVNLILASGDEDAIQDMITRSNFKIDREAVIKFPTRINTSIFAPMDKFLIRKKLNIPLKSIVVSTTGRLTSFKGWKFMLDSFLLFENEVPGSFFYIIGEGEDYIKITEYINLTGLKDKVILAGRKSPEDISLYLNASDLFIMGSYKEGWPTSLVEAIACGIPVCVTKFSAAEELIQEGINGYIERNRNSIQFVEIMIKGLKLEINNINVMEYSINKLKDDLLQNWTLI